MNNFFEFKEKTNDNDDNDDDNGICYMPNATFYEDGNFGGNLDKLKLSNFLNDNFNKHQFSIIKTDENNDTYKNIYSECKKKALNNNKDYFLVEDFSFNNQDNNNKYFQYNCYIPKASAKCEISNNLSSLFDPVNNIINQLFGNDNDRKENSINSIVLTNLNNYNNNETSCTKYTIENSSFTLPRKNNFVLYKTELIDNPILNDLTIYPYKYYTNEYEDQDQNNPSGVLNIINLNSSFNEKINFLSLALKNDICNKETPDTSLEKTNRAIEELNNFYNTTINNLNDLSRDISNITLLTKYDTIYLKTLEEKLEAERKKLRNLFGIDGANNGKLLDTKYMKDLKLNEIIIISLLLIFLIFIYSKKK